MAACALASLVPGLAAPPLLAALVAGATLEWLLPGEPLEPADPAAGRGATILFATLLLVFLLPVVTMPVAPGADMAMHVALARPLVSGDPPLSPAWGAVQSVYPRGFSALVALASFPLGFARAGLLVAGLSYVVFWGALGSLLRHVARSPHPFATAAAVTLLSNAPQGYFGWGGNPNVLAFALALLAAAQAGSSTATTGSPARSAMLATLLMLGGLAIHPMGALTGAFVLATTVVLARVRGEPLWPAVAVGATALGALGVVALLLKHLGPVLSAREIEWIGEYQRSVEPAWSGPRALFPVLVWQALWRTLCTGPLSTRRFTVLRPTLAAEPAP